MTGTIVVLVDAPADLVAAIERPGVRVVLADEGTDPQEALATAAVVVVNGAERGVRLAQETGQRDPDLPVLILEPAEEVERAASRIQTSPFVGRNTRCVDGTLPLERLATEILDEASQHRRRSLHAARLHDIHERQLPAALADQGPATQYLGQLVEHAPIGVATVDPDGRIRGWNPAAAQLTGRNELDALGSALAGLFHVSETSRLEALLSRARLTEGSTQATFTRRGAHGDEQILELVVASLDSGIGGLGTLVLFQDVTVRVRGEAELAARAREAMLVAAVGTAIARPAPMPEKLQACAEAVVTHLDAAFARIWCLDDDDEVLSLRASAGMYTHLDGPHSRIPVGAYKIGRIAARQRPHLSNDVLSDSEISDPDWARREGMEAFAGYPLIAGDRLWGVLALFSRSALPTATIGTLAAVADTVAVGLQQAHSEEKIQTLLSAEQTARRSAEDAGARHALLARTLQQSLLPPSLPDVEGLSVAARYHWAGDGDEIGGDFYDLLALPDGRWCALLGDISGKGVGAARTTALVRYTLRATARAEADLATLVGILNEALVEDPTSDRYCTLVLAAGHPNDPHEISLLLAGHPFPCVLRRDGAVTEVGTPNVPVGMFPDASFDESRATLPEGSTLVLYTDGITDARSKSGVWDPDIVSRVLPGLSGRAPAGIAAGLEEAAIEFQGGRPQDDIAILALRATDPALPGPPAGSRVDRS